MAQELKGAMTLEIVRNEVEREDVSPSNGEKNSACRPSKPARSDSTPSLRRMPSGSYSAVEYALDSKTTETSRRPSIISRLKSSISTFSTAPSLPRRRSVSASDFANAPEYPEKHFIDSVGMVIPGVCDREQCTHPLAHFIISWRLCQPIEYSTTLADHGLTYSDYTLLLSALAKFLDDVPVEGKPIRKYPIETEEQFRKAEQQARQLQELLEEITVHWIQRGVPVMVCVSSYSLFPPNRIPESHVQILHVPLRKKSVPLIGPENVDFNDPFGGASKKTQLEDLSVATPHREPSTPMYPVASSTHSCGSAHHHHVQVKDRTRPWPLWPNAIPSSKRGLIDAHAGRYGVDPFFRAYMRANVDSRTNSVSYAKYLIETEDNPFVNKRQEYVNSPSRLKLLKDVVTGTYEDWSQQDPTVVNRKRYEHNRKLECRRTVEAGTRLRLVRFGFQRTIYPPHTPEMAELGLSKAKYEQILDFIDHVKGQTTGAIELKLHHRCAFCPMTGRRSADDNLAKVSEYIRKLNTQSTQIIWTIERIPGVYHRTLRSGKEWEISAWNAEDPLELLLQLERWGVIEKKLDIEEDE
ncbi:hypothetical protein M011DRAFT_466095 [Sporormia fimetaria CBS 119925]|uniref:Uncharacterized protein n=1 Tax=Sporormia fimetaria CBS 119925 TaxID=1340428 RepID=A0A6A6VGY1_9PLEO|nr:hypothetical protein M011DRAFT_466095 [Sporormia fimetaria CBS 119925]